MILRKTEAKSVSVQKYSSIGIHKITVFFAKGLLKSTTFHILQRIKLMFILHYQMKPFILVKSAFFIQLILYLRM